MEFCACFLSDMARNLHRQPQTFPLQAIFGVSISVRFAVAFASPRGPASVSLGGPWGGGQKVAGVFSLSSRAASMYW